jgi:hypothetical protein
MPGMSWEQANDIKGQHFWDSVCNELDFQIVGELKRLETADEHNFRLIQERIKTLRRIKRLPTDVMEREGGEEKKPR